MSFHHQQVSPQNSSACQNADEAKIAITYGFLRIFPLESKIGFQERFISSSRLGWGHDSRDRANFDTGEMAGAAAVAGRSGARGASRALPGGLPAPARRALADPARCHARRRHPAAAAADFQVFGAWVSLRPGQGDLCGQAAALRAGWGRTQHASCKDHRWRPSVPCAGKIAA